MRTHLHQSPALTDDGVLDAVESEAGELSLQQHRVLLDLTLDGQSGRHHCLVGPWRRNHLHHRAQQRGVYLKVTSGQQPDKCVCLCVCLCVTVCVCVSVCVCVCVRV